MEPPSPATPPYRKLLRRRESTHDCRFITFSTYHRLPLLADAAIADDLARRLADARRDHGMLLFAWVIMPEHVHLLFRAPAAPWSTIARSIKTQSSRSALARWRAQRDPILQSIGDGARVWQHGGGFDRNLRDPGEFTKAVGYIHRNPVKRGLVAEASQWRWSSIRWWMGEREGEIECDLPPGGPGVWENWKAFV